MNIRYLRCFITLAEELHFARAAKRLHMEQSPLSRAIKKLETDLGVQLLERTSRETRLTWAGEVFLEDARRVLLSVEQAETNAKAAAEGYRGRLRIALTDGIAHSRLTVLLALCREEEPDVEIRLFETSQAQQLRGLRGDLYDAGFTLSDHGANGIAVERVWDDPMVVAMPSRHPLLEHRQVPLEKALIYPVVLCRPQVCDGFSRQLEPLLRSVDLRPLVAEHVATHELMIALVAAGYGIGFSSAAHLGRTADVIARPLACPSATFTTYVARADRIPSAPLTRFLDRARRTGAPAETEVYA